MPSTGLGQLSHVKNTAKTQTGDLEVSGEIFTPYAKRTSKNLQLQLTREKEIKSSEKVKNVINATTSKNLKQFLA